MGELLLMVRRNLRLLTLVQEFNIVNLIVFFCGPCILGSFTYQFSLLFHKRGGLVDMCRARLVHRCVLQRLVRVSHVSLAVLKLAVYHCLALVGRARWYVVGLATYTQGF